MENIGAYVLEPTLVVFILAILTHRPIESLITGWIVGLIMIHGVGFVIVLPVVTALTSNLGADMTLVLGATLTASTFGSHACFYSDAKVLTAQASGCTPFQHAITQIPYALIAALLTIIGYLVIAYS